MGNSNNIKNSYNLDSESLNKRIDHIKNMWIISINSKQNFIDLMYSEKSILSNNNLYEKFEINLNNSGKEIYENLELNNKIINNEEDEEYGIIFKDSDINKNK